MYILFEQAGKFLTGRILSETDASAQVELDTGKRVKVKAAHQLLRFDAPEPPAFLAAVQAQAAEVDPALAWEFAPEEEFGFADLAADYFGAAPSVVQQAAALFALHEVPHYFRRAGKGRFRKAPADLLAKALAAIERKQQIAAQVDAWAAELRAGQCPQAVADKLYAILFRPDKNAPEYKAVAQAAHQARLAPLALLVQAGAIASPYAFHWQRFLFENFPDGTGFPDFELPGPSDTLPLADVQAFSVDDADTTEIDDAISVRGLGSGTVTVGIHIAAPGLSIAPGGTLDRIARQRLSTVYMPGCKITMLPQALVQACALHAGRAVPALSLYVTVDEHSLEIQGTQTRLERVATAANLRHDALRWMFEADAAVPADPTAQWQAPLRFLHHLAQGLKAARMEVRGKPEGSARPDYHFKLLDQQGERPTGQERVQITQRPRGEALDLIVSELMVLANCTWGEWLRQLGVPGVYRSQAALAPGVKVRMGTRALPHAGLGVPSYAWSTSPLRRYVDLVNQWQLLAAVRHGNTAALAAPFQPRDTTLLAIVSAFDAAYTAYAQNQRAMERYWTLRYLEQQQLGTLTARLMREQPDGSWLARAESLPLVLSVSGSGALGPGRRVRLGLGTPDLVALDVQGTLLELLPDLGAGDAAATPDELDDEDADAGSIAISMSTEDTSSEEPATP